MHCQRQNLHLGGKVDQDRNLNVSVGLIEAAKLVCTHFLEQRAADSSLTPFDALAFTLLGSLIQIGRAHV